MKGKLINQQWASEPAVLALLSSLQSNMDLAAAWCIAVSLTPSVKAAYPPTVSRLKPFFTVHSVDQIFYKQHY